MSDRGFGPSVRNRGGISFRERISKPGRVPRCRLWPNGEFGLGWCTAVEADGGPGIDLAGGAPVSARRRVAREVVAAHRRWRKFLDLTDSPEFSQRRYGQRGITSYGRKMVASAAAEMQRRYGKRRLAFLTLTIPPCSRDAAVAIASAWGELCRQLQQWLCRRLSRAGLPPLVVGVTEIQGKRLARGDVACLHLHLIFPSCRRPGQWAVRAQDVRSWWCSALSRVSGEDIYSPSCCDIKPIRSSAEGYLAKYMSKGSEEIERFVGLAGDDACPRQWWMMSSGARKMVRRLILCGEGIALLLEGLVNEYFRRGHSWAIRWAGAVEIPLGEHSSYVAGWYGRLSPEGLSELKSLAALAG